MDKYPKPRKFEKWKAKVLLKGSITFLKAYYDHMQDYDHMNYMVTEYIILIIIIPLDLSANILNKCIGQRIRCCILALVT